MASIRKFLLPDTIELESFFDRLCKTFHITVLEVETEPQIFYDTFDWRLYSAGLTLIRCKNELHLRCIHTETLILKTKFGSKKPIFFWQDISDSSLRKKLKTILSVRALLPVTMVIRSYKKCVLPGRNNASIGTFILDASRVTNNGVQHPLVPSIHIFFQWETSKTINAFLKYIISKGAYPDLLFKDFLADCLQQLNRHPADYCSKINLQLQPTMTAHTAAHSILRTLFDVMKKNVDGIITDIDTEFLHDFRVAVRRTRAALSQIKHVFPEQSVTVFKQIFAGLGTLTNPVRDLDVYLLHKEYYFRIVPDHLKNGLKPFFSDLERRRKKELKRLTDWFNTDLEKVVFTPWNTFLSVEKTPQKTACNACVPVTGFARETIMSRYKKTIKRGRKLDSSTPDSRIHQLRLDCKKLRYLMEFFASLFPQTDIVFLIKQLKRLQDVLGKFNDLSVQQNELEEYIKMLHPTKKDVLTTAAAIGGIITFIAQRKLDTRATIKASFTEFYAPHNRKLFKTLFG